MLTKSAPVLVIVSAFLGACSAPRGSDQVSTSEDYAPVVCSPLRVCDVPLEAGDVVNSIYVGDKARWSVSPAITGRTTHLVVKPSDAGISSNMLVYTDKQKYSVNLISEH